MALRFFKQRDIDEMDASNIPDSFVSYFESLSQERKEEIISSRPDLAVGLGYSVINTEKNAVIEEKLAPEETVQVSGEEKFVEVNNDSDEAEEDIFSQIRVNSYENEDLDQFFVDGARPLEVLTIPDKTEKCIIHRCKFEKKSIKYKSTNGSTYGLVLNLCRECKRVFQDESHVEHVHQALMDRHIPHTFFDVGLTNLYLRSQQSAYELGDDEKVYIPDVWIEENPTCPIHEEELFELTCEKKYSNRKISFTGYFCDRCNKILVRKAYVSELIDECAKNGIPEIDTEPLVKKISKKKPMLKKEIRADYFIQDGKRQQYNYSHSADCFKLTEEDTVVVSDSIYCNLNGHDTKEVLAMIMVKQKQEGRKAYLFMVGYCSECQKYYMDEDDYRVVYDLGRPEVTILSDLDNDDYHITSGEVYNLERTHLQNLEDNIDGEIAEIHHQPDYVNPFAVGDYDDGNLSFAKTLSKNKYGARLEELESYQPKPYSYRVDITAEGEAETYYVGASDINLDGERKVISFNSEFGHELVNYQTIKVNKGGKEYDIKLSRQFDIENATLYGYANLRTDEDIIFRSGVTDPFLVRVLNMRKKQHNLIDIIATIQENQNRIVDASFERSLIVQGCAGSGKTMVLLHRLSALQYKNHHFDFGKNALILTPNDQFSLHIKGLAEGLQLGNIDRESVEQYYINMLMQYSSEFKPDTKLVSEMMVRQDFVDYIYSDQFVSDFNIAYEKVIAERNRLSEILDNLTEAMGQPDRIINFEDDTRVVEQIKIGTQAMDSLVKKQNYEVETTKENLKKVIERKNFLDEKIPESERFAAGVVQECIPRVFTKIGTYMSNGKAIIDQLRTELEELIAERQKVEGTILMFGKKARLEQLNKDIKSLERKLDAEVKRQEVEATLFSVSQEGKTDDEILAWMRQVMLVVKEVQDEVRLCKNSKEELEKYLNEKSTIVAELLKVQETLEAIEQNIYSEEVTKAIMYLYQKVEEYSLLNTYQLVFNEAVAAFKEEKKVKTIIGKYHRYDLYAELLFAMKYFKSVHGTTQFMCVDEGQDLALNEYRLIADLNSNMVIFNIFGDTNQLMKPNRGISDWSELKQLYGAEVYVLNENYRNTNQITRFCNSSFGMNVLQTGVDGAKVREIARKDLETDISTLKFTSERLAILVPRGVQKRRYIQKEMLPSYINDVLGDEIGNGRISLLYVDEAKGIEFDKVYVVGNKMGRNEKYIAYTRALSELILVVDDNILDYDDGSGENNKKNKADSKPKNKTENKKRTLTWREPTDSSEEKVEEKSELNKPVKLYDANPFCDAVLTPAYQRLESFSGATSTEGKYIESEFSDADIMDALDVVFTSKSKKDTTYKFVFLKSILDLLDKVDENYRLSFDQLFQRFTEIYWPIVVNCNLRQKNGDLENRSYIEQILLEAVEVYGLTKDSKFEDLTIKQQRDVVKAVKKKCKLNVVGALYGDTKAIIYSFSRKEEWITINPNIYTGLKRQKEKIEERNYMAWAEFLDKSNRKLHRDNDINQYLDVLKRTFYSSVPVFIMLYPVITNLLKVG